MAGPAGSMAAPKVRTNFAQALNQAAGANIFMAGEVFANLDAVGKFVP
ncbi:hypothetical protein [Rhodococcus jostii]